MQWLRMLVCGLALMLICPQPSPPTIEIHVHPQNATSCVCETDQCKVMTGDYTLIFEK
jgi:hypothetical protein